MKTFTFLMRDWSEHVIEAPDKNAGFHILCRKLGRSSERLLMLALLNVRCSAPAGTGTAFMQELCNWADAEQVTLAVFPCSMSQSFVGPD